MCAVPQGDALRFGILPLRGGVLRFGRFLLKTPLHYLFRSVAK
jgi:hypothetical protein